MAEDASRMPPGNRDFGESGYAPAPGPLAQKKLEPLKARPNWGNMRECRLLLEGGRGPGLRFAKGPQRGPTAAKGPPKEVERARLPSNAGAPSSRSTTSLW